MISFGGGKHRCIGLHFAYLHPLEVSYRLARLDAFGDDDEAEGVGERDHRVHDGAAGAVVAHRGDEALVDLQRGDRQLLEVAQRRIARPDVIEMNEVIEAPGADRRDRDPKTQTRLAGWPTSRLPSEGDQPESGV